MRRRTPSEIKAYGDGYAEAYKQFCHLLKKNDKDKAIRKMEIFAKGVEITVETAMDEPSNSEKPNNCEEPSDECKKCKHLKHISNYGWDCEFEFFEDCNYEPKDEPQTDCSWK